jgi:hypothetical protein
MQAPNFGADLQRIHRVITRGINVALDHSVMYAPDGYPNEEIKTGFRRYVQALISFMDAHHDGEDTLAWPALRLKFPDAPYATLTQEHLEIATTLAALELAREADDLEGLSFHLRELKTQWHGHIAIEEVAFDPEETAAALDDQEQVEIAKMLSDHSLQHAQPVELVVPFTLYNLEPEEQEVLKDSVPAEQRDQLMQAIEGPWKEQWEPMKPFLLVDRGRTYL